MAIVAIDQGTSATKALVVDGDDVIGCAEHPVAVSASTDGAVEFDPEALWNSIVAAVDVAMAAAGRPHVEAIGLANQGESVLAWDRLTGRPVGAAISWQDGRAIDVCDRLRGDAAWLQHTTGLPLDPYFVAPKIAWLRDRVETTPRASSTITTTDTWLLHRMCGTFVTDVATAGRTLLLDLDTTTWHERACALFGLDPSELPRVVGSAEVLGDCRAFGFAAPVTGACVDQQAALFGEQCFDRGDAKCTFGTGAFLLASTGNRPVRSRTGLVGCPAWQVDGATTWCLDGQVYTVGAAVRWLTEVGVIAGPEDLDRVGGAVASTGGTQFVPALAGLAAPYWRPDARGAITGLTLGTERGHLVRALIEGISAQVALLTRAVAVDLGDPLALLRVDGGLTRSQLLMQTQADLAQVPIEVFSSPHATALGVSLLARIGVSGEPGEPPPLRTAAVFEPSISADEAETRIASWQVVADATMSR